jgi:uncharacterized protein (DUF2336 family)
MAFFEHALAELAGTPHARAWLMVHDAGPLGLKAIYDRAELSKRAAEGAAEWEVDPLPVVRAQDGRVWAYESAIDEWRRARVFSRDVHRMLREARQLGRHAGPSDRPRRRARWVGGAEGRRRAAPPERAEGVSA